MILQCLASVMPKFAMPSGAKMRKVCKEAKRKNLAVLAETPRLNRLFFTENVGGNHDISFEAPCTLSLAGHIDMLFFRCFCSYLWFLLIVRVNFVSCRITL